MLTLLIEILVAVLVIALVVAVLRLAWPGVDSRILGLIGAILALVLVLYFLSGRRLLAADESYPEQQRVAYQHVTFLELRDTDAQ